MKKTIGDLIDGMSDISKEIDKLRAKIKKFDDEYNVLEQDLMRALDKAGLNKAAGRRASAALVTTRHPNIADMVKFNRYVAKNGAFDLYQRRVNSKAYFDRLENGENVPGVKIFDRVSCRITAKR